MDVFDPAGVLIPAAKKSPSVARDLVVVGGGLLRLGGAAVDAHLDALRRERAARAGRALLVEAGIITSDGELTSEYR